MRIRATLALQQALELIRAMILAFSSIACRPALTAGCEKDQISCQPRVPMGFSPHPPRAGQAEVPSITEAEFEDKL